MVIAFLDSPRQADASDKAGVSPLPPSRYFTQREITGV